MKLAGLGTQVIDLKGRMVVPGLINTHRHTTGLEFSAKLTEPERAEYRVDWGGVRTKQDVLNQVAGIIQKYQIKPGEWIRFNNQISFMGEGNETTVKHANVMFNELNRWELDKAAPNNPILMTEGIPDVNGMILNGVAMDILFKEYGDFIREAGRYWIDSTGRPDGHIEAVATRIVLAKYGPLPNAETNAYLYRMDQEQLAAQGITTHSGRYPIRKAAGWRLLAERDQLRGRVAYGVEDQFGSEPDIDSALQKLQGVVGSGGDKVWINSVAVGSIDGAGSRMCTNLKKSGTGAIDNFYPMGQCYTDGEFRGAAGKAAPIAKNYFIDWTVNSAKYGIRFANTHASGDRSTANMLNAMERAHQMYGPDSTKGWAWDHCDMVNPADIPKAGRFGVQFSCGPHIQDGAEQARQFGDDVANNFTSPVQTMIKNGIRPSFEPGSSPWTTLKDFITRKDAEGKVWGEHERVDRPTALRMATVWGAEYVLKADKIGSLEPGKYADLLVLNKDYLTVPEDEIATIQALATIFDGKFVFLQPQFAQEYGIRPAGALIATYQELSRRPERLVNQGAGGG
jgi:predicted amidohydrolase YtcJ